MCHRCEVSGNHKQKDNYRPVVTAISIPKKPNAEELDGVSSYLEGRGINYERVKDKFQIVAGKKFFRAHGNIEAGEVPAIGWTR